MLTWVCSGARRGLRLCPRCLPRVYIAYDLVSDKYPLAGRSLHFSFVRMNFVLSLGIPLFTVGWPPHKEDLAQRDTLFEIIAERKTRNSWNTSPVSIVACPRVPHMGSTRSSVNRRKLYGRLNGCAHTAYSRFGIICSENSCP